AVALDDDFGDHLLLRYARYRKKYECENNPDRRGATTCPANDQNRGSYLKRARNDENLDPSVNESAIIRYSRSGSETKAAPDGYANPRCRWKLRTGLR